jgi:hypothetical protein
MEEQFLPDLPSSATPSDLAKMLRALQLEGNVYQLGNRSALAQGRVGYELPLDQESQFVAGITGQKAINNPYIPTRPTGFDVGYQDPRQSFTVGYSATPNPIDGAMMGKHNWQAKYKRSF